MPLEEMLNRILLLPIASRQLLLEKFSELSFPKGHILLRPDKVEYNLYFIRKGIARAYAHQNDQEITFWFGTEGDAIISMKNYVAGQPSYEYVELLEDSELFGINTKVLKALYSEDIHIANWGRAFAEQELLKTEERLISRQFRNAEIRYRELMELFPELIQRVQLQYIASYLGITPVSLSRIRAGIS